MKEQMYHLPPEVVAERLDEERQTSRQISCHVKLSPEADTKLMKVQYLLREENIRLSKSSVINLLLENINVKHFSKDLSLLLGEKLQSEIFQIFLNSDMNDEDLKILKMMANEKKLKSKI